MPCQIGADVLDRAELELCEGRQGATPAKLRGLADRLVPAVNLVQAMQT